MKRLVIIASALWVLMGCGSSGLGASTSDNVTVSACQSDLSERTSELGNTISNNSTYIEYRYENNTLWLTHYNVVFNCDDSGIDATASIDGNQITVTETQDLGSDGGAKCLCLYDITIELNDIEAQNYTIVYDDGLSDDINFSIYASYENEGIRSFARSDYPYLDIEDTISNIVIYRTGSYLDQYGAKVITTQTELDAEIATLTENNIAARSIDIEQTSSLAAILESSTVDFTQENLLIHAFHYGGICDYNEDVVLKSDTAVNIALTTPSPNTPCEELVIDYYLAYKVSKEIESVTIEAFNQDDVVIDMNN